VGALAGYTRERREERGGRRETEGEERRKGREVMGGNGRIVALPCHSSFTHDLSVYIKHISTLLKNNELNDVLDKLTKYTNLKVFII